MKVALVSPFDPRPKNPASERAHVGGVERALWEVANGLAKRGHEVSLVCSSPDETGHAMEEGVRMVRAPRRTTLMRAPVADLAKHLPADVDLVHVAATYPFTTPSVLRRAHARGIPRVLDFHFEPEPGTWFGRTAAGAYRRVGPRSYGLAHAVIVRSLAYGLSCPSLARVPTDRWHVVPNGVDTDRFHAEGPAAQGDYVLFVGRLVPYKGLGILLNAYANARIDVPLKIAGDGPMRSRWEALAQRLGVPAQFLGRVPEADLPALFRGARLTVLPSVTGQEAFGMALLESMACGTPVVASDLPGVAELAREGGLCARAGDPNALAGALLYALDNAHLPHGAALASAIRSKYSWSVIARQVEAVYERVLEGPRANPWMEVPAREDPLREPVP